MKVFLSFDIEEFDVPREKDPDYNVDIDGMRISAFGTRRILDILEAENVKATFFCTAKFAICNSDLIRRIHIEGHEVASHGYDHWTRSVQDIGESKKILEDIIASPVYGYRQPRMNNVDNHELVENKYSYNASMNPTFIPGRYMNLFEKRKPYYENDIWNIPASVTPILRIPLFWLALHLFPLWIYQVLSRWTLKFDKILSIYFHPWEFYPLNELEDVNISKLIKINSGDAMCSRLIEVIRIFKKHNCQFATYKQYIEEHD